jgi:hypothetical protein
MNKFIDKKHIHYNYLLEMKNMLLTNIFSNKYIYFMYKLVNLDENISNLSYETRVEIRNTLTSIYINKSFPNTTNTPNNTPNNTSTNSIIYETNINNILDKKKITQINNSSIELVLNDKILSIESEINNFNTIVKNNLSLYCNNIHMNQEEKNDNDKIITYLKNSNEETSNIYENIDDFKVLSSLTLLTKVQPYQKLVIKMLESEDLNTLINFEIRIDNSMLQPISRWINCQSRNETIDYINKLIDMGIRQYQEQKKKNNKIGMNKYAGLLESSKFGLSNLKITYNSDQSITSNLDIIIEKIDVFRLSNHNM